MNATAITTSRQPAKIVLADGRVFTGELPLARQRSHHLGMLHRHASGLVEIAAGARRDGRLSIRTRKDPGHYLAGGQRDPDWLAVLALVAEHDRRGDEVFVGPAEHRTPQPDPARPGRCLAGAATVTHTRWLWVDIDAPHELHRLWELCRGLPAHLLLQSGSGGYHAYWQLDRPLPARHVDPLNGELVEPIEAANARLAHHLAGDPACRNRDRLLRVAGTINHKTGTHARLRYADFQLPAYPVDVVLGALDPAPDGGPARRAPRRPARPADPYKQISPPRYFLALADIRVPPSGLVSCPDPRHEDRHPSCHVGQHPDSGWICFACGAAGAIYDLASVLKGGPTGPALRGEAFHRARRRVHAAFGALTTQ